jgi:hypothetical protein
LKYEYALKFQLYEIRKGAIVLHFAGFGSASCAGCRAGCAGHNWQIQFCADFVEK